MICRKIALIHMYGRPLVGPPDQYPLISTEGRPLRDAVHLA